MRKRLHGAKPLRILAMMPMRFTTSCGVKNKIKLKICFTDKKRSRSGILRKDSCRDFSILTVALKSLF